MEKIKEILRRIAVLKTKLKDSDYQAIKFAEGEISASEYSPIREQRKAWRNEINALQQELKYMRG